MSPLAESEFHQFSTEDHLYVRTFGPLSRNVKSEDFVFLRFGGPDFDYWVMAYTSVLNICKSSTVDFVQNAFPFLLAQWAEVE